MPAPSAMSCPFCRRMLTTADRVPSGRFSCPDCAKTLREAEYGWFPRVQAPASSDAKPSGLTPAFSRDKTFAKDMRGETVERQRTCECGAAFTQRLLSDAVLAFAEKHSAHAAELMERQIPGGYVPVHCPPCERRDLGRQARLDDSRRLQPHYTERNEAAD